MINEARDPHVGTGIHMHPTTGNMQAIVTCMEELCGPVLWPTICLFRWPTSPQMLTHMRENTSGQSARISFSIIHNKGETTSFSAHKKTDVWWDSNIHTSQPPKQKYPNGEISISTTTIAL
ncbi:hypothetical protein O181_021474 [Austropuccinia psidii MF-1]|uniref:Uncharacterized protein n=1 Tax=Austropuccinia psidii MF-1 TaxID=1389203 RepID=A0A9Q3CD56_9BASI|nr:hypothetical protein [Austropuccinia psidii MF-1]